MFAYTLSCITLLSQMIIVQKKVWMLFGGMVVVVFFSTYIVT